MELKTVFTLHPKHRTKQISAPLEKFIGHIFVALLFEVYKTVLTDFKEKILKIRKKCCIIINQTTGYQ